MLWCKLSDHYCIQRSQLRDMADCCCVRSQPCRVELFCWSYKL